MAISRGSQNTSDYFIGDWDYVAFITPKLSAIGARTDVLGMVSEGSLELSREDYQHQNSTFPRRVDFTAVTQAGMTFSGNVEEMSLINLRIAMAQDPATAGNYIYPGTSCTDSNNYGALKINRIQCQGFQNQLEVVIWKALAGGALSFGGGDEVTGIPVEFVAQDDTPGNYDGSSAAPLGYLYHTGVTV